MAALVLTVTGVDRPGLVSAVSGPVEAHGGSWEQSQMARLAGTFAGIVLVTVPEDQVTALERELYALSADGLEVRVERAGGRGTGQPHRRLRLHLVGGDRLGIVAEVSGVLATRGVGIEELATDVRDAPMSGGRVFEATASLVVPADVDDDDLRTALERIADELMVDLDLGEG